MSKMENLEKEIKNIEIKIKKLEFQKTILLNKYKNKQIFEQQKELKNSNSFKQDV